MCILFLQYRIFLNGFGYAFFGIPSRDLESTWKSDRVRTPVFSTKDRHSPLLANGPSTSCDIATPNYIQHVSMEGRRGQVMRGRVGRKYFMVNFYADLRFSVCRRSFRGDFVRRDYTCLGIYYI